MSVEQKRKILHISIIVLAAIFITLLCIILIPKKDTTPPQIELPVETGPIVIVDQQYIRTSTLSWEDGMIFGTAKKADIKSINFVQDYSVSQDAYIWSFDGFRCALDTDGKMYFAVGADKVKIKSLSMARAFANLPSLETISGLELLDMSDVKNISELFANDPSLKYVDFSGLDLRNIVSVDGMFDSCSALTVVNLENVHWPKVTSFQNVFRNCHDLTEIKMPILDVVYNYTSAFEEVGATYFDGTIIYGDIPFSECYIASSMFKGSNLYTYKYVEEFDTQNLFKADSMFEKAIVDELNLSNWSTSNLEDVSKFCAGAGIEKVSLKNWDASHIDDMSEMFQNCSLLQTVYIPLENVQSIKSTYRMFKGCYVLQELDFTAFNGIKIGNAKEMFSGCTSLTTLLCDGLTTEISNKMFYHCNSINGAVSYDEQRVDGSMATVNGYFKKEA